MGGPAHILTLPGLCSSPHPTPPCTCLSLLHCSLSFLSMCFLLLPVSMLSSSAVSPAPPPASPALSIKTGLCPLPIHLSPPFLSCPPPPRFLTRLFQSLSLLNLLASPFHLPAGPWASYPARLGAVSVGPCPWGSSLGAVLAALAAQEGREQGPGEGGGSREGAPGPSAGRGKEWLAEWPGSGRGRGETRGAEFGALRRNK